MGGSLGGMLGGGVGAGLRLDHADADQEDDHRLR